MLESRIQSCICICKHALNLWSVAHSVGGRVSGLRFLCDVNTEQNLLYLKSLWEASDHINKIHYQSVSDGIMSILSVPMDEKRCRASAISPSRAEVASFLNSYCFPSPKIELTVSHPVMACKIRSIF